jgi:hypothetical protein
MQRSILQDYFDNYNLRILPDSGKEIAREGDKLRIHNAIIVGLDRTTKKVKVFHNHPEKGAVLESLADYCRNRSWLYTGSPLKTWNIVLLKLFKELK